MFQVISRELGRGKGTTKKFKTLETAAEYVKSYFQGPEYIDDNTQFHTDYCTYELVGFTFKDIGRFELNLEYNCREYFFNS